jgi:hypothetical protein
MTIYDLNGADKNLYSGTGSEENLKKVISALLKDADTMDKNELRKSQNDSSNALFDIAIEYENEKEETSYAYIYITDEFKNTISIKDELGFKSISRDYLKKEISTKNHFSTYENKDDIDLSTAKTVYFQAPESWDSKEQIYANLYSEDNDEFLYLETEKAGTNGAVAKCEKVKDNIWKFTYYDFETPVIDKYGFTKVMFYQYTEDNVNCTGCIKLNKKNNCLKLKKKKKNVVLVDYEYPLYKYSWEKLR